MTTKGPLGMKSPHCITLLHPEGRRCTMVIHTRAASTTVYVKSELITEHKMHPIPSIKAKTCTMQNALHDDVVEMDVWLDVGRECSVHANF